MNISDQLQLTELQKFARKNFIPVVQDDTCNFLHETVKQLQPKQMLEIGTAIGYSGIVLLNASKGAHLTTMELDASRYQMAQQNFKEFGVSENITSMLGDAMELLKTLPSNTFDFVFLDGPKGQYLRYLPSILNVLTVGGIVFCDNLNTSKFEVEGQSVVPHKKRTIYNNLNQFRQHITNNKNLQTTFYEVGDTVAIIKKLA